MKRHLFATMAAVLALMCITACSTHATANSALRFSDIPIGEVRGDAIEYICAEGYMVGKTIDAFAPDAPLTRAEVAVVMLRAKHGVDYLPTQIEGEWWAPWVNEAVSEGLLGEIMDPDAPATRADIATLMWLLEQ